MEPNTSPPLADVTHMPVIDIDTPSSRRPTRRDMLAFVEAGRVLPGGHVVLLDVCHPSCHPDGPPSCHYDV